MIEKKANHKKITLIYLWPPIKRHNSMCYNIKSEKDLFKINAFRKKSLPVSFDPCFKILESTKIEDRRRIPLLILNTSTINISPEIIKKPGVY